MDAMDWIELEGADSHLKFQMDLSCLLDGELDESTATRAVLHIEDCGSCRGFFDDIRSQLRLHRDMADPDRLFARIAMLARPDSLSGGDFQAEADAIDLVHRLSTVFYQLGKAYVLSAIDPDFRTRVFEKAVPLEETRLRGRGFVDGVLLGGKPAAGNAGVDWEHARSLLNGRLERIADPLEKGRRLLDEAIAADPSHEEARLYLAFLHAREGKSLLAADEYREVFHSALSEENRGHAAAQLGKLYVSQGLYREALVPFRWVTVSGLSRRDERFFFIRFNIGMCYAMAGDKARALDAFRALLDEHPGRLGEIIEMFAKAVRMHARIESIPGFPEELMARCPELFSTCDAGGSGEGAGPGTPS
jgi:tetratricopeptide (TPR) repeat protein